VDNSRVTTTMLLASFSAWLMDDLDFDLEALYGVPAPEIPDWLYARADRFMAELSAGGVFLVASDAAPALTLQHKIDLAAVRADENRGPTV
jgi:hypothetical protein